VIVLGIDPGTAALGYGIVESTGSRLRAIDYGVVATSPDAAMPDRLRAAYDAVTGLVATHAPTVMAVERLFFSRNVQTAFAVGQARGVVLLAASQAGVAVVEATPNEVKSAIAGYGAADKEQVQRMVQVVLGMDAPPSPDDAADALAIAVWAAGAVTSGRSVGAGGSGLSAVMDRAAVAPIARGQSGYARAVREALARERAEHRS
jgi:crossover junction endodeoxyribonuclease RuvC